MVGTCTNCFILSGCMQYDRHVDILIILFLQELCGVINCILFSICL